MSELQTPAEGTELETALPEETQNEQVEETTQTETKTEIESEAETPTEEPAEPQPQPDPDYKEKFVDSQRESILNAERVRIANEKINTLTKTDTPTDEAMRQVYPEWDDLNDITKKALIRQEAQEMRQRRIEKQLLERDERDRLEDSIDQVIESNPRLAGKEAEFRRFARNPKNHGISADFLAKAFLFDAEPQAPKVETPSEALPVGSGGPREDLKPKKISLEESAQIRKTDYKRWKELVEQDLIDDEI